MSEGRRGGVRVAAGPLRGTDRYGESLATQGPELSGEAERLADHMVPALRKGRVWCGVGRCYHKVTLVRLWVNPRFLLSVAHGGGGMCWLLGAGAPCMSFLHH